MPLQKKSLLKPIKILFSDVRAGLISFFVSALLGGGAMYLYFRELWPASLKTMQSQTPLWATIALVFLLVLYAESRIRSFSKNLQSKNPISSRDKLFPHNGFLWKISYNKDGDYEVATTPLCEKHELSLACDPQNIGDGFWYCHEPDCETKIRFVEAAIMSSTARSYYERSLRRKNKC